MIIKLEFYLFNDEGNTLLRGEFDADTWVY